MHTHVLYHPLNERRIAGIRTGTSGKWAMRIILGFLAIALLLLAAEPASAVCVNRGGTITCDLDKAAKYAHFVKDEDAPDLRLEAESQSGQAQPSAPNVPAWVLTP